MISENKDMKYRFKQDQLVMFDVAQWQGCGLVKGVATTKEPIVGHTYIIQPVDGSIPKEGYPFSCIALPESHIKPYPKDKDEL